MEFLKSKIYTDIVKNKTKCYFVSPHFDDAVFSAGGLITNLLKNGVCVDIINVFTKASSEPYTISAKRFIKSCGYSNADDLYIDREIEDKKVFSSIGIKPIKLDLIDAIWRRKKVPGFLKLITQFLPEIEHVYPVFSLNMKFGKYSLHDQELLNIIYSKLSNVIGTKSKRKAILFCPIGIGNHMDHLIVRDACINYFDNVVLWEDVPYSSYRSENQEFIIHNNLTKYNFTFDVKIKSKLANGYKTQIQTIFNSDKASLPTIEHYYVKNNK
jgi:LmbE family N-acetylglucosaminyl deacetylase